MPPKGKAIDISSSSVSVIPLSTIGILTLREISFKVVDLKAQLAQHTEEFQRIRAGAKYGRASTRPTDKVLRGFIIVYRGY